jgi:hypothetical protein
MREMLKTLLTVINERGVKESSLMNKFYINYICPGKSNLWLDFQDLLRMNVKKTLCANDIQKI